jgi:hypothetical protein
MVVDSVLLKELVAFPMNLPLLERHIMKDLEVAVGLDQSVVV